MLFQSHIIVAKTCNTEFWSVLLGVS